MILHFNNDRKELRLELDDHFNMAIAADCVVRNEINGWRKLHYPPDVVYAITDDPEPAPPVMPREFPPGVFEVFDPRHRTSKYLAPYFIPTEAEQYVEKWSLDSEGGYDKPTGEKVLDIGYGLHYSASNTTLGCIRIQKREDLILLKNMVKEVRERGARVWLRVEKA